MSTLRRDPVVAQALARVPVPDHAPGFWARLDGELSGADDVRPSGGRPDGGRPDTDRPDEPVAPVVELAPVAERRPRRPRLRRLAAAAAAVAVAVTATAVIRRGDGEQRVQVGPATPDAPTQTTLAPNVNPAGSEAAVLEFLDALGAGDLEAAAARLGPRSEAYVEATAGSVEEFLVVAQEGFGSWAVVPDRMTRVVHLRPGDAVVVVSGVLTVEGATEERSDAFPVRYAESAGAWFVEPWAVEPGGEMGLEIGGVEGGRDSAGMQDGISVTTPGPGTAWLSVDGGPAEEATAQPASGEDAASASDSPSDSGARATWSFTEPLAAGEHVVVVAFVDETTFSARAATFTVEG